MNEINYEALLKKYIQHVIECEGTDFLGNYIYEGCGVFTDAERATLRELSTSLWPHQAHDQ